MTKIKNKKQEKEKDQRVFHKEGRFPVLARSNMSQQNANT